MLDSIEFLHKKDEFRVGDFKNLAVNESNKNDMSKVYKEKTQSNIVSNADMLSQNFGASAPTAPETQSIESATPTVDPIPSQQSEEPVQITGIPNVQNNFNMEANPVDLSLNANVQPEPIQPELPTIEPAISNQNIISEQVSQIEPVQDLNNNENSSPVIEPIPTVEPSTMSNNNLSGIDSGFKVSDAPNIFDNPLPSLNITEDELNKPLDNNVNAAIVNDEKPMDNINNDPSVNEEVMGSSSVSSINDDIVLAQIAIEESNVKHYEALAENSKKKIELLKRQVKNNKKDYDNNLENTASNLFNSNGVLDEAKVLGLTPSSNLNIA